METFLHDNFSQDSGLFLNETTNCTITHSGGAKVFVKTALSWDNGGHRTVDPRVIQNGDTYELVFSIDDYHPGPLNQDNSNIAIFFRWQTPQAVIESNGWGLYITPAGAYTMSANEAGIGPTGPLVSDIKYTAKFVFKPNGLEVYLTGAGQPIPQPAQVGTILSSGIIGSNAWFEFNVVSATTVRLHDVRGFNNGT